MKQVALTFIAAAVVMMTAGCDASTSRLSPAMEQRFASEGVTRKAADLIFRYTRDPGGRGERREDRRASIVVTRSSVFIYKNEKVGLDITARTRREVAVERTGERVRIRAGRGRNEEVWSFEPPDDAAGWATDIRAVIKRRGP